MKVYSWIGGDRPQDTANAAKKAFENGFDAIKMNATEELQYIDSYDKIESVVQRVAGIREAAGNQLGFGIDFHGRVHKPMAKVLAKELEPYNPMFIEEPVLSENIEAVREISQTTTIPIALGERLFQDGISNLF